MIDLDPIDGQRTSRKRPRSLSIASTATLQNESKRLRSGQGFASSVAVKQEHLEKQQEQLKRDPDIKQEPYIKQEPIDVDALDDEIQMLPAATVKYDLTKDGIEIKQEAQTEEQAEVVEEVMHGMETVVQESISSENGFSEEELRWIEDQRLLEEHDLAQKEEQERRRYEELMRELGDD